MKEPALDAGGINTGITGRLFTTASCQNAATEAGAAQHDVTNSTKDEHPKQQNRHKPY
jgi:hypothetical protein